MTGKFDWLEHLPYSSFQANDLGWMLYGLVRALKPKRCLEFGVLYGYSTMFISAALRDNGNDGNLASVDSFSRSSRTNLADRLIRADLHSNGTLLWEDYQEYIERLVDGTTFDFILFDVDNDGQKVRWAINNLRPHLSKKGLLVIEGGATGRDTIPWMLKDGHEPIMPAVPPEALVIDSFPGLIIVGANEQD